MKKELAIIGGAACSAICCYGAWKLCELQTGYWGWFLTAGLASLFLTCLVALAPEEKKTII